MDENMTTYIYGLFCPVAQQIRYVGKSDNPVRRFNSHIKSAKKNEYEHHASRWLRTLLAKNLLPKLVYLEEVESNWQEAECRWISHARLQGWPITNSTDGGDGAVGLPEESLAKLSLNMARMWRDPVTRQKLLEGRIEAINAPEFKAASVERMKARWRDPVYVATIGEKVSAGITDEQRSAASALMLRLHATPDFKEKVRRAMSDKDMQKRRGEAIKKAKNAPEARARVAEQVRLRAQDKEFEAKRGAAIKAAKSTPAARAKVSEQMRLRHQDPDYVAKMAAKREAKRQANPPKDPEHARKARERRLAKKQAKLCDTQNSEYHASEPQQDQPPCA